MTAWCLAVLVDIADLVLYVRIVEKEWTSRWDSQMWSKGAFEIDLLWSAVHED